MVLTDEMIKNLPLSEMPEDYDGVDEITEQIINEFNAACDEIEAKYDNQSNNTNRLVSEGQN